MGWSKEKRVTQSDSDDFLHLKPIKRVEDPLTICKQDNNRKPWICCCALDQTSTRDTCALFLAPFIHNPNSSLAYHTELRAEAWPKGVWLFFFCPAPPPARARHTIPQQCPPRGQHNIRDVLWERLSSLPARQPVRANVPCTCAVCRRITQWGSLNRIRGTPQNSRHHEQEAQARAHDRHNHGIPDQDPQGVLR